MENNTVLVKPKTTPNRMLDEITNSMHLRAPPESALYSSEEVGYA